MLRKIILAAASTSLLLFLSCSTASAAIIRVPSDQPTIQAGIDAAVDGDIVLIADGTYTGEGNRNLDFFGRAITVTSKNGPVHTVIDCEQEGRGFRFSTGEDSTSIVNGMTVTGGETGSGGGIYCSNASSPSIIKCIFIGNNAIWNKSRGGGLFCSEASSPIIRGCIFSGNTATRCGGGICCSYASPTIIDCTISDNAANPGSGGGICCTASSPSIINCTISGNTAYYGGGIDCSEASPAVANCTLTRNSTFHLGDGIRCTDNSAPIIINCILWNDADDEIYSDSSDPIVVYSDIMGGWPGAGNIDEDPLFFDSENDDLHIQHLSPCIDAGTDVGVYTDFDGEPRPNGSGFDIGADEYYEEPQILLYPEYFVEIHVVGGETDTQFLTVLSMGTLELEYSIEHNPVSWLTLAGEVQGILEPGDSIRISLQFDSSGLDIGIYEDTILVHSNDIRKLEIAVPVTLQVRRSQWLLTVPGDYALIQDAIEATLDGDTVLVADGTYSGAGNMDLDFLGKAITLLSENGSNSTMIDCERNGRGVNFVNEESGESTLKGFSIINGDADRGGGIRCVLSSPIIAECILSQSSSDYGGGIYCEGGSPEIIDCLIQSNYAGIYGGGIYCTHYSSLIITDCTVSGNSTENNGGAIYNYQSSPIITGCTISGNPAENDGGGIYNNKSSPIITGCTIPGNSAGDYGGGIYNNKSSPIILNCDISENTSNAGGGVYCTESSPVITDCSLSLNTASSYYNAYGGGIYCIDSSPSITYCTLSLNTVSGCSNTCGGGICCIDSSPSITYCTFSENSVDGSSKENGGAIYCIRGADPYISNSIFTCNTAADKGGCFYFSDSSPVIINCTISGNTAYVEGGGIYCDSADPTIISSILWNDSPDEVFILSESEPTIRYSDVQGGWTGEGNIDADPLFRDPDNGDYRLQNDSPCIDAGDPYSRLDEDESCNDMGVFGGKGSLPQGVIGGIVSGRLEADYSPYIVSENLVIQHNDTLIIEPGVVLQLHNRSGIRVYGELQAAGAESDSIILTKFLECDTGGGVRFISGSGFVSYCRIGNQTEDKGRGIFCDGASPTIMNCKITGNSAEGYCGGGVYCYQSSPTIMNCTITGNSAEDSHGGGVYCKESSPVFFNCKITGNSAEGAYGGGFSCYQSSPTIMNCTITGNSAEHGGGIFCNYYSDPEIMNCIVWSNSSSQIETNYTSNPNVKYSDVQGGWDGEGNIDEDPVFFPDPIYGFDYLLKPSSPCIDAGDPSIEDALYDWHPRWPGWFPDGARSDMGAYGGPGNILWLH